MILTEGERVVGVDCGEGSLEVGRAGHVGAVVVVGVVVPVPAHIVVPTKIYIYIRYVVP